MLSRPLGDGLGVESDSLGLEDSLGVESDSLGEGFELGLGDSLGGEVELGLGEERGLGGGFELDVGVGVGVGIRSPSHTQVLFVWQNPPEKLPSIQVTLQFGTTHCAESSD